MTKLPEQLSNLLYGLVLAGAAAVIGLWFAGLPPFYTDSGPVMSVFTAFSLFIMSANRLSRRLLHGFPTTLSLGLMVLVIGGNLSSIMMLSSSSGVLVKAGSTMVVTSMVTSLGLILFCSYDVMLLLRKTPGTPFILDDIVLYLALVPGGLSFLGHLLDNPAYLSMGADPRIGISLFEMVFMAAYAAASLFSNRDLFLWQFLSGGWPNRFIFAALFANQFIAPVIAALIFGTMSSQSVPSDQMPLTGTAGPPQPGPGLELFIMLAGVLATLTFLSVQAASQRSKTAFKGE